MTALSKGEIRFVQQQRPALPAGDYTISVAHQIENKDKKQNKTEATIRSRKKFSVAGERFHLDDAAVQATFPPAAAKGDFSQALPHIVLKHATLPWERSADGAETPWLALLLFHGEELRKIKTEGLPLKEVRRPPGWLESGEDSEAHCTVLEVPQDLLVELLPRKKDLPWLCHVRQVRNDDKEAVTPGGLIDYAVVVGNRRSQEPPAGSKNGSPNRVHLVSLEGYYDDAQRQAWYQPDKENRIQLISLTSWEYTAVPSKYSFTDQMRKLDAGVLKATRETEDSHLQAILATGFTLLEHQTRQGDKTASLYRGPLVPCAVTPTVQLPIACGDEAVRFYPEWGVGDVSYAAAWQLGRLLALQNSELATLLYQWKVDQRREGLIAVQRRRMAALTMAPVARAAEDAAVPADKGERFGRIAQWLAELRLLAGVPLHYLLPEPAALLPDQAIRFFQVDLNWVDCLLDGAFSLGRATRADRESDRSPFNALCREAQRRTRTLRHQREDPAASEDMETATPMTGAVIRSDIVTHWPGLEVEAFGADDGERPLPLMRMARLADDILICIFAGELAQIRFSPPAEGLHYALQPPSRPTTVRHVDGGKNFEIPIVESESVGRVDISGLAEAIQKQLRADKKGEKDKRAFTSADLGLSLVAARSSFTYAITPRDES